jgi:hypothetical protein
MLGIEITTITITIMDLQHYKSDLQDDSNFSVFSKLLFIKFPQLINNKVSNKETKCNLV